MKLEALVWGILKRKSEREFLFCILSDCSNQQLIFFNIVISTLPSQNRTWVERCQNLINKFNLPGKNKQLRTFRDDIYSRMKIPGGLLPYFHFLIKFCICRTIPKWNCVKMSQISNIKTIRNCVIKIGSGALYLQVFFLYSISDKQHIILVLHSCKMAKFRFPSIYCCATPLWYGNPLPNLGRNLGSWGSKKSGFTLKCQIGHNLPLNRAAKRFSSISGTFEFTHQQKMTHCLHTHFHLQLSFAHHQPIVFKWFAQASRQVSTVEL